MKTKRWTRKSANCGRVRRDLLFVCVTTCHLLCLLRAHGDHLDHCSYYFGYHYLYHSDYSYYYYSYYYSYSHHDYSDCWS